MIWTVFNDNTAKHSETGGAAFGVEVHASAYAFICPTIADSDKVLNYTTFYNYKVINRSTYQYDSCYLSNWVDEGLGNENDDYIGCDVMNNYGYAFNGDSFDESVGTKPGYGQNLPAFACNILNGPYANANDGIDNNNNGVIDEPNEKCLMYSFEYYTNTGDPQTGNPISNSPIQYYNLIHGFWKNGTPVTYGGNGTSSLSPVCRHVFPGNSDPYGISMGGSIASPVAPPPTYPGTGWTMKAAGVVKNDMRFSTGVGPFSMQPGGIYEFDYAYVFSQDSLNCYGDTVLAGACILPRAQRDNIKVKNWFDTNTFPSCLSLSGLGMKEIKPTPADINIYPNPASNLVFIEFKQANTNVTVELFDMFGNLVKAGTFTEVQKYISIPVDDLQNGLYQVRIRSNDQLVTKKFVKQ